MSASSLTWDEIEPHLNQALELEPPQLGTFLAELDATRPHIAVALRKLIARRDALREAQFLEQRPLDTGGMRVVRGMLDPSDSLESYEPISSAQDDSGFSGGAIVGPYRLIRLIANGGTSSVWLAERCDVEIKRRVALKLPFPGSQLQSDLFLRERDMLAALTHPGIARLYDAGVSDTGQPYLAMEYVEGTELLQSCDARSLTVRERLQVFLKVLDAVQFAHAALIIHRDLKPSNILMAGDGRIVLLDFGIGKLITEPAQKTTRLGRALTLEYASPEQILGMVLGVASDVYSLGVILYELLTGLRPYRPKRESAAALEEAILMDTHQAPSRSTLMIEAATARGTTPRALARTLAGDLDTIALKALKQEPLERYSSVLAFAQDIDNYLRDMPVSARPDSLGYRLGRFLKRHKLPALATSVAMSAVLAGAGVAVWQAREAQSDRDHVIQLAQHNSAISDFLGTLIMDSAAAPEPITVQEMLERAEDLALADTAYNPEELASILETIAGQFGALNDKTHAARLLERALALTADSKDHGYHSRLICSHATASATVETLAAAAATIDRELATLGSDPDHSTYCSLYRSYVARDMGDGEAAVRFAKQALAQYQNSSRRLSIDEGLLLGGVAGAYQQNEQRAEADRYYRLAMQSFRSLSREYNANAISTLNNWALMSLTAGVPKNALEQFDQILGTLAKRGSRQPPPIYLLNNRASALERLGRYSEAQSVFQRGSEVAARQAQALPQSRSELGLATTALALGDLAAAETHLQRMAGLLGDTGTENNPAVRALNDARGRLELAKGRLPAARRYFERALPMKGTSERRISIYLGKAEVELRSGEAQAAAADAQAALDLAVTAQTGFDHADATGLAWLMLGRVRLAEGKPEQGRAALQSALEHLSNTVDSNHQQLLLAQQLLNSLPRS